MSDVTGTLRVTFEDEPTAHRVAAAMRPDDDAFVQSRVDGRDLVVTAQAATVRSLLRAIDDVLGTIGVSEDLIRTPPFDDG